MKHPSSPVTHFTSKTDVETTAVSRFEMHRRGERPVFQRELSEPLLGSVDGSSFYQRKAAFSRTMNGTPKKPLKRIRRKMNSQKPRPNLLLSESESSLESESKTEVPSSRCNKTTDDLATGAPPRRSTISRWASDVNSSGKDPPSLKMIRRRSVSDTTIEPPKMQTWASSTTNVCSRRKFKDNAPRTPPRIPSRDS